MLLRGRTSLSRPSPAFKKSRPLNRSQHSQLDEIDPITDLCLFFRPLPSLPRSARTGESRRGERRRRELSLSLLQKPKTRDDNDDDGRLLRPAAAAGGAARGRGRAPG